tara:strand:- start:909 stop:2066 length:1158 start_codon:yes stop_codon:yes gene_type:complete
MTLNINGTTGISGVDGSASAPALQGTDSNTGINFASDTVNINTAGTTRATVDSDGRLLLGTTTEGHDNADDLTVATSGETGITIRSGTGNGGNIYFSDATSGGGESDGYISYSQSVNKMFFGTNQNTRMTIDSSGNLGIGTTNPSGFNPHAQELVVHDGSGTCGITISSPNDTVGRLAFADPEDDNVGEVRYTHSSNTMEFTVNAAERMRIDSSGRLLINVTGTQSHSTVNNGSINASYEYQGTRSSSRDNTGTRGHLVFYNPNGHVGGINTSGSATNFNTSSDYRLKENVVAISDGITRLKTLKPSRFNFKKDADLTVDGFLAHEVTAVPEAITGTKDEVDSDNNPVYQSIDQSKLVPLLTAALQEAIGKIEALETKVATLEAT